MCCTFQIFKCFTSLTQTVRSLSEADKSKHTHTHIYIYKEREGGRERERERERKGHKTIVLVPPTIQE